MTAAATTGPKRAPRPTSSTPATSWAPSAQASFSYFSVHLSFLSSRSLSVDIERCSSPGLSILRYFFARFDGFRTGTSAILAAFAVERAVEIRELSVRTVTETRQQKERLDRSPAPC